MLISLVDGSPKPGPGASSMALDILSGLLRGEGHTFQAVKARSAGGPGGPPPALAGDAMVISFPLYFDGVPSTLLSFLERLMARAGEAGGQGGAGRTHVYAVSNSGFFDPGRNRGALGTIRLFAGAMGYSYGQGLALEGGPVIPMMPGRARLGKWPLGSHHKALRALAGNIGSLGSAPDSHAQPDMPRFMYNLAAGQYFRGLAKRNGLRRRDLSP